MMVKVKILGVCVVILVTIVVLQFLFFHFVVLSLKTQWLTTNSPEKKDTHTETSTRVYKPKLLHIWGKAAISQYFWEHIFGGSLQLNANNALLQEGQLSVNNVNLIYKTGFGLNPYTSQADVKDLVIILNGRDAMKVANAFQWLSGIVEGKKYRQLRNLGIVILGNELCDNFWLVRFSKMYKIVKFVFVIYDFNTADHPSDVFKQWPLGVATYRNFQNVKRSDIDTHRQRQYVCNFLGTVYANSSREIMVDYLGVGRNEYLCFLKARYTWEPNETKESLALYLKILENSDLTLCPTGVNSESYRIYEAMSYGSVPVIEDVMTEGHCGGNLNGVNAPFRLLKQYNAPVIFVKNWLEIFTIIEIETNMSDKQKIDRRQNVIKWYESFKSKMRDLILNEVNQKFD